MVKKKTQDEMVLMRIGQELYNEIAEYLVVLINGKMHFDDDNPGIRLRQSQIDKVNAIKNEDERNKTFINFEMTLEHFEYLSYLQDYGAKLAFKMVEMSKRKHDRDKRLSEITINTDAGVC